VPNEKLVLIIEDNEDDVFMLQHAIRKAGITNPIHVVRTGEDAIAYLAGADRYSDWNRFPLPSIVLLDLKLPGLSGLDVLAWIRKTSGLQNLRVTILTGAPFGQQIKQASELGANWFTTKPVDHRNLIEMMKTFRLHWLELSQAPQVSRLPHPAEENHPSYRQAER
jgi:CheY-like chemotaxis protein